MSELTPAAIEEALNFAGLSGLEGPWLSLHVNALATTIAYVRTQATNEALEWSRDIVDCVRFTSGSDDFSYETVEQAANEMMRQIVDKKVPT